MTPAIAARRRRSGKFYLMIAPALLLSGVVVLIPGILTAYAAFTDWDGLGLHPAWVGLANFREIFADPVFRHSLRDNLVWTALFLTIPVVIGLLTAMLLLRRRTRTVYQVIYLIPYVLAPITNAVLWLNIIYNPISGVIGFFRNHGSAIDNPLASTATA